MVRFSLFNFKSIAPKQNSSTITNPTIIVTNSGTMFSRGWVVGAVDGVVVVVVAVVVAVVVVVVVVVSLLHSMYPLRPILQTKSSAQSSSDEHHKVSTPLPNVEQTLTPSTSSQTKSPTQSWSTEQ